MQLTGTQSQGTISCVLPAVRFALSENRMIQLHIDPQRKNTIYPTESLSAPSVCIFISPSAQPVAKIGRKMCEKGWGWNVIVGRGEKGTARCDSTQLLGSSSSETGSCGFWAGKRSRAYRGSGYGPLLC
jgi:hypothetical protein